ncbi:MAG: rhodanese-like domain-containing protein [Myxococcales bacterium]|nr:rhodanese-like domain-containing protein [Myxococcales bacterium]
MLRPSSLSVLLVLGLSASACEAGDGTRASGSGVTAQAEGRVDGARAKQLVSEGATLLDVRTADEYAAGHAGPAKNIPVGELGSRIAELDRSRPVVTYCAVGARSRQAAELLRERGFTVYDLGRLSAWPN